MTEMGPYAGKPIPLAEMTPKRTANFHKKIVRTAGCWVWTGSTNGKGYGRFRIGDGMYGAHRVTYALHHRHDLSGLLLDHLCGITQCVNPDHLEIVSQRENIQRGANGVIEW